MTNPIQRITSAQNPKVKEWAGLLEKKNRDRSGRFLIEGVHLLLEAIKADAATAVEAVVIDMDRGWPAELRGGAAVPAGTPVYEMPAAVIAKCTGTDTPPPVFAVAVKPLAD